MAEKLEHGYTSIFVCLAKIEVYPCLMQILYTIRWNNHKSQTQKKWISQHKGFYSTTQVQGSDYVPSDINKKIKCTKRS